MYIKRATMASRLQLIIVNFRSIISPWFTALEEEANNPQEEIS